MKRYGQRLFRPGRHERRQDRSWMPPKDGFSKIRGAAGSPAPPRVALEAPDLAVITYEPLHWYVHVCATEPHFGGRRRWLVCPACSSRRTALYIEGVVLASESRRLPVMGQ